MSLLDHLIHTCTLQRSTVTGQDRYQRDIVSWAAVDTDLRCRLIEKTQRAFSDALAQFIVVTGYTLLLTASADAREGDRITDVQLEDGAVQTGPFRVRSMLRRRARALHHLSLDLEVISSATCRRKYH